MGAAATPAYTRAPKATGPAGPVALGDAMKDLGLFLLGIWLVVHGLQGLLDLHFRYDDLALGVLGIAAGALIIIRR